MTYTWVVKIRAYEVILTYRIENSGLYLSSSKHDQYQNMWLLLCVTQALLVVEISVPAWHMRGGSLEI